MNRIAFVADFFHKSEHPKIEDGEQYSVDVLTCDGDGLLNIAFYNYDTEEWSFHAETMHDSKKVEFIWMYAPEEFILKAKQKMNEFKKGDKVRVSATATGLGIEKVGYVSKVKTISGRILITVDYIKPDVNGGVGICVNSCHVKKYDNQD